MNHKDYFDSFEEEHGRMPSFEEFCRDCSPEPTHINKQVSVETKEETFFTKILKKYIKW